MFSPSEVANNYVAIGKGKVNLPLSKMLLLSIMAGIFIAFGGIASTTVSNSVTMASIAKLAGAAVFPAGLMMVMIVGAELFTGNCLLAIPLLEKEISFSGMLRSWIVVWIGNFIGSIIVSAICVFGHQASLFGNGVAVSMISTAVSKLSMPFFDGMIKGIACNVLVCCAVWMALSAKQISGKLMACYFPVMTFVICGFEHSIANMYFITAGLFANMVPQYAAAAAEAGIDTSCLSWGAMFTGNLIPVTIGNIIGGFFLVGCVYWFCYVRKPKEVKK